MDYKYINQLLELYWDCKTTLEEEEILRSFFSQIDIPEEFEKYRPLFLYEQVERQTNVLGNDFDEKILSMIADNARVPFLEVARACNVSGAAIHQRIQKLTQQGVIKGSQFIFDPETLGYETCAFVGLYLKDPSDFDRVVEALRAIPEVVECHYTTGGYDMFIKIYARNNHHMLSIIHDKLQPLGLQRSETIISFHEAIKRQFPVPNNPADE